MISGVDNAVVDLTQATWVFPSVGGRVPSPRVGCTVTAVPGQNGCLLFGGASHEEGFRNDLFWLDLGTMTWTEARISEGPIPKPRYEHMAAVVFRRDGANPDLRSPHLLVFGGSSEEGLLNDLWDFDLATRKWTQLSTRGKTPSPRTLHSCGVSRNPTARVSETGISQSPQRRGDRVYIFGGGGEGEFPIQDHAVYCLDVDMLMWIQLTQSEAEDSFICPSPRLGHTLCMSGKRLFMFGGGSKAGSSNNELWVFDTCEKTAI
ncbi:hypothetical protein BC829DRAFT_75298 [Chytridium lagenaria]|nr:hypothetical protein BC829DRAFT_75298 [Chytridium lagenaria]